MLDFGVTVLPDPPYSRWLELIQVAEKHGFGYAWTYDSHVLWQESVPLLAVAARETSKIKLGHFVTNPATRARRPGRPAETRRLSSASAAPRATSPTTSPPRAIRCAGSQRWSRTT